ncbi:MAG TPA: alpha/beta hydrolase, partial [Cyclobacteriaceae bacterium]
MKGIVNRELNERAAPSVNALMTNAYSESKELNVLDATHGDEYDGDDTWYQLDNGNYVWAGAVDLVSDDQNLTEEDKIQYLISYRKIIGRGIPDKWETEVPDRLYFTPVRIGTKEASIRVNEMIPDLFVNSIAQSVKNFPAERKHVFIYIHGFQPIIPSLGMELLNGFTQNYMTHQDKKIAKLIMMTWPAQSISRKYVDDRAIRAGQQFTANHLFEVFKKLSVALHAQDRCLNLVLHSFGHQLLNGMVNPPPSVAGMSHKVFENIFFMAPDITYLSVKQGGASLPNYYVSNGGNTNVYNYDGLTSLTDNIYAFHDESDYVLYSSTQKFVKDASAMSQTDDYRNLGNYGNMLLAGAQMLPGLQFRQVSKLTPSLPPIPFLHYPFQDLRNGPRKAVERVRNLRDYSGLTLFRLIANVGRFTDHHRYLFTHKPVV